MKYWRATAPVVSGQDEKPHAMRLALRRAVVWGALVARRPLGALWWALHRWEWNEVVGLVRGLPDHVTGRDSLHRSDRLAW